MGVLQWLWDNRQWLFDGAGGTAVAGLIVWVWRRFTPRDNHEQPVKPIAEASIQRPQPSQLPENQSSELQFSEPPSRYARISAVTRSEIVDAIIGAPPYQEFSVAEHFKGIVVRWETAFFSANPEPDNFVRLMLVEGPSRDRYVWCSVKFSDYPELSVLRRGATIRVTGRISKANVIDTELEDVELLIRPPRRASG
jgi:hypothetical protein